MNLELIVQQNSLAIQKLLDDAKDLSQVPRYTNKPVDKDLLLFRIDNIGQSVAMEYSVFIEHIKSVKLDNTFPELVVTKTIVATENTFGAFVVNQANYTFNEGAAIIIVSAPDVNGDTFSEYYLYNGDDKSLETSYNEFTSARIEWNNIVNKPTDLETTGGAQAKANQAEANAKSYADALIKGGISERYANYADMAADQVNQVSKGVYAVADASGFSTVDAGYADFEYLGTTLGTEADYRKLSEEESMDIVAGGVQSVTGSAVDNTDPNNPVINSTGGTAKPDSKVITGNYVLTAADSGGLLSVEDYASVIIPTGLGLKYRIDVIKDSDKIVSFTAGENVVLQYPDDEFAEILKKYNGVSLAIKKIVGAVEYWGVVGALKIGQNKLNGLKQVVRITDLSINQMTYPYVYESALHTGFATTKPFFTIYSTDHETTSGAQIWWGEMDDPEGTNFAERAQIITGKEGYQPESPHLTVEAGVEYLYFHTMTNDPDNASKQQTHLISTSSGLQPHLCTWTLLKNDASQPVLGIATGDNHTGYAHNFKLNNGTFLMYHTRYTEANVANNKSIFSTSTDLRNWTRVPNSEVGEGEAFTDASGRFYRRLDIKPFYIGTELHALCGSGAFLSVCKLNPTTFKPSAFVKDLVDITDFYQYTFIIYNGIIYIWLRDILGGQGTLNGDWYLFKYNFLDL